MGYKLKMPDGSSYEDEKEGETSSIGGNEKKDDFSDFEDNVYRHTSMEVSETKYDAVKHRNSRNMTKLITSLVFLVIFCVAFKFVYDAFFKEAVDITQDLGLSEEELASKLKLDFVDNENEVKQIHQYSNGKVTVRHDDDISLVYIDGKKVGIKLNSKKYSLYGVRISDAEIEAVNHTTFVYDDHFFVIKEEASATSNEYFYYNVKNNDCLLMIVNNSSNRIVSLTYYYDYKKISEKITLF